MRIRTGHGPDDWTPSIPASTGSSRLGGDLVVGGPGAVELQRQSHRKSRRPSHDPAARRAARARAAEIQREYRARVRVEVDGLREERAS